MVPSNISKSSWIAGRIWLLIYIHHFINFTFILYSSAKFKEILAKMIHFLYCSVDADCWKDLSLIGMPKKKTCRIFFIQMSSFVLSINKTDFPLTAPVINPFELLIIFFSCFLVSKAIHFFHLIIWWLLLLLHENSKFLRILFGLTFTTWIL